MLGWHRSHSLAENCFPLGIEPALHPVMLIERNNSLNYKNTGLEEIYYLGHKLQDRILKIEFIKLFMFIRTLYLCMYYYETFKNFHNLKTLANCYHFNFRLFKAKFSVNLKILKSNNQPSINLLSQLIFIMDLRLFNILLNIMFLHRWEDFS